MHCQAGAGSELGWKIPVIVLMFVVAIVLAVALQTLK